MAVHSQGNVLAWSFAAIAVTLIIQCVLAPLSTTMVQTRRQCKKHLCSQFAATSIRGRMLASSTRPLAACCSKFVVANGLSDDVLRQSRRLRHHLALADDLVQISDEVLNTVEDAALHFGRVPPWLTKPDVDKPNVQETNAASTAQKRKRVVVLGTGWGAHALSKIVDLASSDVCVVSPRNYFVFTPMLAAASVGTVEYRSILEHIRSSNPSLRFHQGLCEHINVSSHQITVKPVIGNTEAAFHLPYDVLVLAVGLRPSSKGVPGIMDHCMFLKDIQDARRLRQRVTECFERADLPTTSEQERRRLLTFVVIGGGPTGCEFCGELSDFIVNDLERFYPQLARDVSIILIHRGRQILPAFGNELQNAARDTLLAQRIQVRTALQVIAVDEEQITVQPKGEPIEEKIAYGLCVWSAGQESQPIIQDLYQQIPAQVELLQKSRGGSALFVDDWLRIIGIPDGSILALGDCARMVSADPPLPQTAQVAAQQGAYAARLLNRCYNLSASAPPTLPPGSDFMQTLRTRGQVEAPRFQFLNLGLLAYLGGDQAVAEVNLGSTPVSQAGGRAAFLLWRSVYAVKQVSLRNRILVLFDWLKSRVFGRDLTRF